MPSRSPMDVTVDKALCASFGRCITAAPDAFTFDDDDQAAPLPPAGELTAEQLAAVVDRCPTRAISVRPAGRGLA